MLKFKRPPFEEDIEKATNENNLTEDWSMILHVCDKLVNYEDGAKYCLKAILKRLHHNVPRVVLQTLTLLDACVKNCDRKFLLQVASNEFTTEVRKLLPKMHPSASLKLKELLQRWACEEFKDDQQLCIIPALYYQLKSEGVEFPPKEIKKMEVPPVCTDPNVVTSQEEENDIIKALELSLKDTGRNDSTVEYGSSCATGETPKASEPFPARVLYDFEAAEGNELSISKGELILVVDDSNEYWWKGVKDKAEGLFPAKFVVPGTELPDEPDKENKEDHIYEEIKEIKIDEEKIELALKWLSEADPTGEMPDPPEMNKLERECYKMAPLIEEDIQTVDNCLAKLSLVNKEIMDAFDMFYSLSNCIPASKTMAKNFFAVSNRIPQPLGHAATDIPNQTSVAPVMTQGSLYVPAPSSGSEYIMAGELSQGRPICAIQNPMFYQPPFMTLQNKDHQFTKVNDSALQISNEKSPEKQASQLPDAVNHYGSAMMVQQAPQFVAFSPAYGPLAEHGFIQRPVLAPNYVPVLAANSMNNPMNFPVYYMTSPVPPCTTTYPAVQPIQNKVSTENVPISTDSTETNFTTTVAASTNYSCDLTNLSIIDSDYGNAAEIVQNHQIPSMCHTSTAGSNIPTAENQ